MKVVCILVICCLTSVSRAKEKKEQAFVEKLIKAVSRVEKVLKVGLKDLISNSKSNFTDNTKENHAGKNKNGKVETETEEEDDDDEDEEDEDTDDTIIESTKFSSAGSSTGAVNHFGTGKYNITLARRPGSAFRKNNKTVNPLGTIHRNVTSKPTTKAAFHQNVTLVNLLNTSNSTKTTQQMTITTSSHIPTTVNSLSSKNKTETSIQIKTTTLHPYPVHGQNKSATKNSGLVDIIGTLESVILKDVLVLQDNGTTTQTANISNSGIPMSTQAPTVPTTFPGAYKGYSPVMKKVPKRRLVGAYKTPKHVSLKNLVKRSASPKRRPSPLNHKRSERTTYSQARYGVGGLTPKERRKLQREITKQLQMTISKSTKCERHESGSVGTDVLKELWEIRKLLIKLGISLRKDVRRLGNQEEDNSNEERADIRTNSNTISSVQKGLSSKINDLKSSLSLLMTAQNKLFQIVGDTLAGMMEVFRQIIGVVIKDQSALNVSLLSIEAKTNKTDFNFLGTENETQSSHILHTREIHTLTHKRSKTGSRFKNDQIHIRNSNSASVVRSYELNGKDRQLQQGHLKANNVPGWKMTVTKSTDCSHADTEVLREVVQLRNSLKKLSNALNKGVHQIVNQAVDNTNEERSEIKTNSDRISQLEESLSGKIDDLRYNISLLMMSQRDLGHTFSNTLISMMLFFRQIVSVVTEDQTAFSKLVSFMKKLKQIDTERRVNELIRSQEQNDTMEHFDRFDSNQEHNKKPFIYNINTLARHDSEVARNNLIKKMNSSMSVVTQKPED